MTIAYVAAGTEAVAASGDVTPGLPSGWTAGDIHICVVDSRDNVVPTMPAGWSSFANQTQGAGNITTIFWKRAVGSDVAPLVTHAAGDVVQARITGWRNAIAAGTPVTTPAQGINAQGTPVIYEDYTPSVVNEMILWVVHMNNDYVTAHSAPDGTGPVATQAYVQETTLGSDQSGALAYGLHTGTSAVGSRGGTVDTLGATTVFTFGILPSTGRIIASGRNIATGRIIAAARTIAPSRRVI